MKRGLRYSRQRALYIGVITSLVSFGFLILAANMSGGVPTTALASVSGTLLTFGIVSIVYEMFLRETVMMETLEVVGLQEKIHRMRLVNILFGTSPDYADLSQNADFAKILLSNVVGWVERDWRPLLAAAKSRPISIVLYLPNPNGIYVNEIARRQGYDVDQLRDQMTNARDYLESSWKSNRASLWSGSSFKLKLYDGVVGYDIAVFDPEIAVSLVPTYEGQPGESSIVFIFKAEANAEPGKWFKSQLVKLDALPDSYADEVK